MAAHAMLERSLIIKNRPGEDVPVAGFLAAWLDAPRRIVWSRGTPVSAPILGDDALIHRPCSFHPPRRWSSATGRKEDTVKKKDKLKWWEKDHQSPSIPRRETLSLV